MLGAWDRQCGDTRGGQEHGPVQERRVGPGGRSGRGHRTRGGSRGDTARADAGDEHDGAQAYVASQAAKREAIKRQMVQAKKARQTWVEDNVEEGEALGRR